MNKIDDNIYLEGFFELHSIAMEGEKDKKMGKKGQFFSECKKFKLLQCLIPSNRNKEECFL